MSDQTSAILFASLFISDARTRGLRGEKWAARGSALLAALCILVAILCLLRGGQ